MRGWVRLTAVSLWMEHSICPMSGLLANSKTNCGVECSCIVKPRWGSVTWVMGALARLAFRGQSSVQSGGAPLAPNGLQAIAAQSRSNLAGLKTRPSLCVFCAFCGYSLSALIRVIRGSYSIRITIKNSCNFFLNHSGSAKAITASPDRTGVFGLPPAQITTYCFPFIGKVLIRESLPDQWRRQERNGLGRPPGDTM